MEVLRSFNEDATACGWIGKNESERVDARKVATCRIGRVGSYQVPESSCGEGRVRVGRSRCTGSLWRTLSVSSPCSLRRFQGAGIRCGVINHRYTRALARCFNDVRRHWLCAIHVSVRECRIVSCIAHGNRVVWKVGNCTFGHPFWS